MVLLWFYSHFLHFSLNFNYNERILVLLLYYFIINLFHFIIILINFLIKLVYFQIVLLLDILYLDDYLLVQHFRVHLLENHILLLYLWDILEEVSMIVMSRVNDIWYHLMILPQKLMLHMIYGLYRHAYLPLISRSQLINTSFFLECKYL
jgi:hypothetical protein